MSGGQTRVVCDHVEEGGGHSDCDAPSDRPGDQCNVSQVIERKYLADEKMAIHISILTFNVDNICVNVVMCHV